MLAPTSGVQGRGEIGAALSLGIESGPDFCIPFICTQVNKNFGLYAARQRITENGGKLLEGTVYSASSRRCLRIFDFDPDFASRRIPVKKGIVSPSLDRVPSHLAVLTLFGLGPPERLHRRANFEQHAASINPNRQVTDDDGHYWY
jgi:hypothetical protein